MASATPRILSTESSPFSARVRIAAALKGLSLDFELPPGGSGGTPELKKITAFGRVPTLLVDNHVLVESVALIEYLEDAYPGTRKLRPSDPIQAARVRALSLLWDHNVGKAINLLFAQLMAPQVDPVAAKAAIDAIEVELAKLVTYFDAEGPAAIGGQITMADCVMAPLALVIDMLAKPFGVESPTQRVPRFKQWWIDVRQVPEIEGVVSKIEAALIALMAARKAKS